MTRRRSRRFALGNNLQGGAFSYRSEAAPVPLSLEEEAILAFAGSGITGRVYGELPYEPAAGPETGGGQVMITMLGRTFPSADGAATAALFINRDEATYMMRRPQDFGTEEIDELAEMAKAAAQTVHLERTGQFIDEDAPDDVASAIEAWWAIVSGPSARSGPKTRSTRVSGATAGGGPAARRKRSSGPS